MRAQHCDACGAVRHTVDGPAFCPACLLGWLGGEELPVVAEEAEGVLLGGRYRLKEKVGEGGFAEVWRARQEHPVEREVAVKWLKAEMVSRQVLARFEGERSALARMNHPGVATVLDAGSHDGRPFFVVDLVRGGELTEMCGRWGLGAGDRCRLLIGVCEAVQHAHGKGVVHRDLKPANILAWEEGCVRRVKVIDFGVARALEEPLSDLAVTAVRQLVGTPGYMSPEQAEPGSADIDVRSDVYALGVVMYEVMAGRLPFASAGRRGAGEEVPVWPEGGVMGGAPRAWRRDLLAIAGRAMAMSPGGRYASAQALADDLQRVLDEQPVSARPARGIEVLGKLARRHRAAVVLGMLAVVSLVAGMAASLVMYWRAETRAEDLRRARAREDVQTAQRWKAERQFHGAMPVLARALETEPDAVAAADLMLQAAYGKFMRPVGLPVELRSEWGELRGTVLTGRTLVALLSGTEPGVPVVVRWVEGELGWSGPEVYMPPGRVEGLERVAVSGAGNRVAVWGRESMLWCVEMGSGLWLPVSWPEGGAAVVVEMRPTGESGLVATEGGVVWRVGGLRASQVGRVRGRLTQMAVTTLERQRVVVAGTAEGGVYRWVAEEGVGWVEPMFTMPGAVTAVMAARNARAVVAGDAAGNLMWSDGTEGGSGKIGAEVVMGGVTAVTYDPGMKHLFAAYERGALRGWTVGSGREFGVPGTMPERVRALKPMGGAMELLVVGAGGSLRAWHPATGRMTALLSSAGAQLAAMDMTGPLGTRHRIVRVGAEGRGLTVIDSVSRQAERILLEPYGARLLTWSGDDELVGMDGFGEVSRWSGEGLGRTGEGMRADGEALAMRADGDGAVVVVEKSGRVVRELRGGGEEVLAEVQGTGGFRAAAVAAGASVAVLVGGDGREVTLVRWGVGGAVEVSRVAEATEVTAVVVSGDGGWLGCGHADGEVTFCGWGGVGRVRATRHLAAVTVMAWGAGMEAASGSEDGTVMLWEAAGARGRGEALHLSSPVRQLAWSGRGGRLAAAAQGEMIVVDAASGFTIGPPLPLTVPLSALAFNGSGTRVAGATQLTAEEPVSGETAMWLLPPPGEGVPGWFLEFARAMSGQRLAEGGQIEPQGPVDRRRLGEMIPVRDGSSAAALARWLTAPEVEKPTIHPWHRLGEREFLELMDGWPATRPVARLRQTMVGRLREEKGAEAGEAGAP